MARFRNRGSAIQFDWHETQEGKEFFGGILRRNRRKMFGKARIALGQVLFIFHSKSVIGALVPV